MTTQNLSGSAIAERARAQIASFSQAATSVGEVAASGDTWGAKEICSHVLGDAQDPFIAGIRRALDEDSPVVIEEIGLSQMTADREAMSAADLASAVATEYENLAQFVAGLSEAQLARTLKVPPLAPFIGSDTISVGQWAATLFEQHLPSHTEQLQALAGS